MSSAFQKPPAPARAGVRHSLRQGRLDYRAEHPRFPDGRMGYEEWTVTTHDDARACCAHAAKCTISTR